MKRYYDLHKDECSDEDFLSRKTKLKFLKLVQDKMDLEKEITIPLKKQAFKMLKQGKAKDDVVNFIHRQTKGIDFVSKTLLIYEIGQHKTATT